jgi:uncharacterized protein (TIGR00369 family)
MLRATRYTRCIAGRAGTALERAREAHQGTFGMSMTKSVAMRAPVLGDSGTLEFPFTVVPEVCNSYAALHGGAYAALADVFTTAHLWGVEPHASHVSMDFSIQYYAALPAGTQATCVTKISRLGGRVAFTSFSFRSPDGTIHAEGTHTKAITSRKK